MKELEDYHSQFDLCYPVVSDPSLTVFSAYIAEGKSVYLVVNKRGEVTYRWNRFEEIDLQDAINESL